MEPTQPFNWDMVNDDPNTLTILLVGTIAAIRQYMIDLHNLGYTRVNDWSLIMPLPGRSDKYIAILQKTIL